MKTTIENFLDICHISTRYNDETKDLFHSRARKVCQVIADAMALPKDSYEIRSNKGGIAISGEMTLHSETLYLQIQQGSHNDIMFRSCNGRKDYCGGSNNWASFDDLRNMERFCKALQKVSGETFIEKKSL